MYLIRVNNIIEYIIRASYNPHTKYLDRYQHRIVPCATAQHHCPDFTLVVYSQAARVEGRQLDIEV